MEVLGDAQAVDDGRPLGPAVEAGGGDQVPGGYTGEVRDPVGRVVGQEFDEFRQPGGAFAQELLVGQRLGEQDVGEPVEERHIGAGTRAQVYVRVQGEAHGPWIGDDQPGSAEDPPQQPGSDHRMGLDGIGPDHQQAVGPLHVVEGVGAAGEPEGSGEAGGGGGVAQTGAVVDVVGADDDPHELLYEVVLLVGGAGRGDRRHGVRAARLDGGPQAPGDMGQRLVPAGRLQHAVASQQGPGEPFRGGAESVGEAALHARVAAVDRAVPGGQHRRDLIVPRDHVQGAAHTAVAARGARPALRRVERRGESTRRPRLADRPRGAGVHAAAAGHAVRLDPGTAGTRGHDRVTAPADQGEGEGALHLGAHPHAPAAGDAQVPVQVDVRVGVVHAPASGAVCRLGADAQRPADVRQFAGTAVGEGPGRQRGDDELHRVPAQPRDIVAPGVHAHAGGGRGDTGRHDAPSGPHQTRTA